MKISDITQKVRDIYAQNSTATQQQSNQANMQQNVSNDTTQQSADKVELSSGSRLLQRVNEAAAVSDVQRSENVQQIQSQVQNGTYEINPDKIAGAMMRDLIKEIG